jgi:hypothetical protein
MKTAKKFLLTTVIVLVLGGAAFFVGWAQLTVPMNAYGVLRSKTHGIDPTIIHAGEFRWVWFKLIPGNVEIQAFTLDPQTAAITMRDTLPSGAEYAAFAGSAADFSYELNGTLSFNLKSQSLIKLLQERRLNTQADLNAFAATLADELRLFALQRLRLYIEKKDKIEELLDTAAIAQLNADIGEAFPDIEHFSLLMYTHNFPDLALYDEYRALYHEYIAAQRDYLHTEAALKASSRVGAYIRFDDLAKYGELLTKYPILLQFIELEARLPEREQP